MSAGGKYRPGVAAVIVGMNLVILLLPFAGIFFFRIYESQLVRETEAELIAQAAVLASAYKQALRQTVADPEAYGKPVDLPLPDVVEEYYTPVLPRIDLANAVVGNRRPRAREADTPPDQAALEAGARITELFIDAQRATLAGMRLLDHRGTVIGGRGEVGESLAHVDEIREALDGTHSSAVRERQSDEPKPPITSISRGTGIRIFVAYPVVEGGRLWGVVYMSRTPASILQHLWGSRYRLGAIGAFIAGLTLLIAWVTTRTLVKPIRRLSAQARELSEGRRRAIEPLDHYGTREIAALGQSFADMAAALERRSQYLRDFAAHVSHEFKTPLTSIRGAVELLGEHHDDMDRAERQRFLGNIDADAARLKALVERLLDLARADSARPMQGTTDPTAAIAELAGGFPGLEIAVAGAVPQTVRMSDEAFRMIAGNLIENAAQAGATRIEVEFQTLPSGIRVLFRDNGSGISPGNRAKIYDPFFTTRRETGGTGIGLGIVRALAEAHGGSIELLDSPSGAVFALGFRGKRG
ncbi:MAG TPA: ATP-binding protein [Thermohalobaculum sp.]|nr:ATP-binding protein [Thermohalobaculum sp.]